MTTGKRIAGSAVVMLFALIILGCTTHVPMVKSGLFSPVEEFSRFRKTHVYFHLDTAHMHKLAEARVLHLQKPRLGFSDARAPRYSAIRQNINLMEERLYYNIVRELSPEVIVAKTHSVLEDYRDLGYGIVDLETSIAEVRYGSGIVRWLIGYGLGGILLQVEGTLTDSRTGKQCASFIYRARYGGEPLMGLNVRVISRQYCLKGAIDQAAEEIAVFCKSLLNPE